MTFNGTVVTAVGRSMVGVEASLRARFARPARRAPALLMPEGVELGASGRVA